MWSSSHKSVDRLQKQVTEVDPKWGCTLDDVYIVSTPSDVPFVVTALLNARRLGHVCYPCKWKENTKDSIVQRFQNTVPSIQICDEGKQIRADRYVCVFEIENVGIRFDVLKQDYSKIYFHSIKAQTRLASVGQVLSNDELLERLVDIKPCHLMQDKPQVATEAGEELDCGFCLLEKDFEEQKEIMWWNKCMQSNFIAPGHPQITQLKDAIVRFTTKYMVNMHAVTADGKVVEKNIFLGFNETFGALGIPLLPEHFEELRAEVQKAVGEFFPNPPCAIFLVHSKLRISQETLVRETASHNLIVLSNDDIDKIRVTGVADFCCAVRFEGSDLPVVAIGRFAQDEHSVVSCENGTVSFSIPGKKTIKFAGKVAMQDHFEVLNHYTLCLSIQQDKVDNASSAILRKDSFSLCLCNDASVYSLSPIATWAWLSYEFSPYKLYMNVTRPGSSTSVIYGKGNTEDAQFKDIKRRLSELLDMDETGEDDPECILAVGTSFMDVFRLLSPSFATKISFLDWDICRLEDTMDKALPKISKSANAALGDVFLVPREKLVTLLEDRCLALHSIDARSSEAQEAIRKYLTCGMSGTELWEMGPNVFTQGTIPRPEVEYLQSEVFVGVTKNGPFKVKSALTLIPKCGSTTALLQLVLRCQNQENCVAHFVPHKNAWDEMIEKLHGATSSKVLVVLGWEENSHPLTASQLAKLKGLKDKRAFALVVLYIRRLALFHDRLPVDREFTFAPVIVDEAEKAALIEKYKGYFQYHCDAFNQLEADVKTHAMLISTPSLLLCGAHSEEFARGHASEAVRFALKSLEEYDANGEHHKAYLRDLCLLTCTSRKGSIQLGFYMFKHRRWSFLITQPTESVHQLTSRLWIPVLLTLLAPELQLTVDSKTFTLGFEALPFSQFMVIALTRALKTGSSLMHWLRKYNSRPPLWLRIAGKHGEDCLKQLLGVVADLRRAAKKQDEKLLTTEIQLHVLFVDVSIPKKKNKNSSWTKTIERLQALASLREDYFLIRHYRGKFLFDATINCAEDDAFVQKYGPMWLDDFSACARIAGMTDGHGNTQKLVQFISKRLTYVRSYCQTVHKNTWINLLSELEKLHQMATRDALSLDSPIIADPSSIYVGKGIEDEDDAYELAEPEDVKDICDPGFASAHIRNGDEGFLNADQAVASCAMTRESCQEALAWFLPCV